MHFRLTKCLSLAFILAISALTGSAAQATQVYDGAIPEPLRPWVDWVLKDDARCPYLQGGSEDYRCAWASKLELSIEDKGGQFSQRWHVYDDNWIPLPGNEDHWPQDVRINGRDGAVLTRNNEPFIYLKAGDYTISGGFLWDQAPESFQIPPDTGLLNLKVKGRAIPFPKLEEDGLIWLQKTADVSEQENRLDLRVYRKLIDDIPFQLITQLTLNVSGQTRELVLDQVLPKNFVPMTLISSLPARLEKDGSLRVQVKAGGWTVTIGARHRGPLNQLGFTTAKAPWPPEELWVFEARNDLRLVWVEGVASIDPQQTSLPHGWKNLPAYRLTKGNSLKFVQKRRGDSDPSPDQLTLNRKWWLDFDGGGFTIHDEISGTLNRSWRLEMNPPLDLGRISVDNKDQFITRLPDSDKIGVEIRRGHSTISADSRINQDIRRLSAVGWDHDFQKVSGTLHLPPGWSLFNVSGVDRVSDSWIERWTLLDIFLVLIIALSFLKIWGMRWGAVALVTLVLTFLEGDAPQWTWLAVVLGYAILRLVTTGKFHTLMRVYKIVTLVLLFVFAIPFMVTQLRVAIYPALEHKYRAIKTVSHATYKPKYKAKRRAVPPPAPMPAAENAPADGKFDMADLEMGGQVQQNAILSGKSSSYYNYRSLRKQNYQAQRPGAKVQTGPGLPRWNWDRVTLTWNGPVEKNQSMRFIMISPFMNLILSVVRVLLLALLLLCVLDLPPTVWKRITRFGFAGFLLPLCLGLSLTVPQTAQADFPPEKLLGELHDRLTKKTECFPNCFEISRMQLEVSSQSIKARLQISAQDLGAIPLPGSAKEWTPSAITVDGRNDVGVIREDDGQLWIELTPGVHQVTLSGPLASQDTIQISLPLKPHHVSAQVAGWTLEGLHEDGKVDTTLQLTRKQTLNSAGQRTQSDAKLGGLAPFVMVNREISLGIEWEVTTRVVRMSPVGTPVVLNIPLLAGESVISAGTRVDNRKVLVNMGPNVSEVIWRSVLKEGPAIKLKAANQISFMERWMLDVSPVWHVEFKGIPVIHPQQAELKWIPEWRPWPGEQVTINVTRPIGVVGETLTIDKSVVEIQPGLRFTKTMLDLELRSSLGGQHVLTLPTGSELQSVSINNKTHPIRLEGNKLTLPIVPGKQTVKVKWQESSGIKTLFKAPQIDIGTPSVNSMVHFKMPRNRWILFVWGPRLGPAVMFWSLLTVVLLFSFGLSRVNWVPLRFHQWFLLGVGITQFPEMPVVASIFLVGWFLFLAWRQKIPDLPPLVFNLRQVLLCGYSFLAILALFAAIHQGLLGHPDMQIGGNGSSRHLLRWYQDRSTAELPWPWTISIPLFYYRIAMLGWALWIAFALMRWLKWGWQCFSTSGLWKPFNVVRKDLDKT